MDARAEVEDAYRRQLDAMVARDVDALDELLADDYTARHITGYEQPKVEWLTQMRDGQFIYHHIDLQSLDVSLEEGAATGGHPVAPIRTACIRTTRRTTRIGCCSRAAVRHTWS